MTNPVQSPPFFQQVSGSIFIDNPLLDAWLDEEFGVKGHSDGMNHDATIPIQQSLEANVEKTTHVVEKRIFKPPVNIPPKKRIVKQYEKLSPATLSNSKVTSDQGRTKTKFKPRVDFSCE